MNTFDITFTDLNGHTFGSGNANFIPHIGEKFKSNGYTYKVEDVIYDFGYGQTYGAVKVTIKISLI